MAAATTASSCAGGQMVALSGQRSRMTGGTPGGSSINGEFVGVGHLAVGKLSTVHVGLPLLRWVLGAVLCPHGLGHFRFAGGRLIWHGSGIEPESESP